MFTFTKAITHTGVFHADDVFCSALLKILNPDIDIQRVRSVPDDIDPATTIVFDIGGGEFDHHNTELKLRPDGDADRPATPYSAFGLLWKAFGKLLVDDIGWETIDNSLVIPIDLHDNGRDHNPLSAAIATFNPFWNENGDFQTAFDTAVSLAQTILQRAIDSANSNTEAKDIVAAALQSDDSTDTVLVLDRFVPWQKHIPDTIRFAVFPALRGGWNVQSVNSNVFPLPAAWLTQLPEGMTFCHPGRFLAACTDKATAIKYAAEADALV